MFIEDDKEFLISCGLETVSAPEVRKELRKTYGSLRNAADLPQVITRAFRLGTYSESYKRRHESLSRLGFDTYSDYIASSWWGSTRSKYCGSQLLQRCMLCGSKEFHLHHTDYRYLGCEDITKLLPLCGGHHKKLHMFLAEYGLPIEASKMCLQFVGFKGDHQLNRTIVPFRRCLLNHKLNEVNRTCTWESYRIGTKASNKIDKKTIKISDFDKPLYFDAKQGIVQIGYNGKKYPFEVFCHNLAGFLS